MTSGEVTDLLAALRSGDLNLDQVAQRFRDRSWPRTRRTAPVTPTQMADQQDLEPDVPGSYDEVTAAYDRGELSAGQYDVLSQAVADSINAEAARAAEGGSTE